MPVTCPRPRRARPFSSGRRPGATGRGGPGGMAAGRRASDRGGLRSTPGWPTSATTTARCSRACGRPGGPATTCTPRSRCPTSGGRPRRAGFSLHPALFDAALHAGLRLDQGDGTSADLPFSWSGVQLGRPAGTGSGSGSAPAGPSALRLDVVGDDGALASRVDRSSRSGRSTAAQLARRRATAPRTSLYQLDWTPVVHRVAARRPSRGPAGSPCSATSPSPERVSPTWTRWSGRPAGGAPAPEPSWSVAAPAAGRDDPARGRRSRVSVETLRADAALAGRRSLTERPAGASSPGAVSPSGTRRSTSPSRRSGGCCAAPSPSTRAAFLLVDLDDTTAPTVADPPLTAGSTGQAPARAGRAAAGGPGRPAAGAAAGPRRRTGVRTLAAGGGAEGLAGGPGRDPAPTGDRPLAAGGGPGRGPGGRAELPRRADRAGRLPGGGAAGQRGRRGGARGRAGVDRPGAAATG